MSKVLVLSGGAYKGAFQYAMINRLSQNWDVIYGTSIGAINGALLSTNNKPILYDLWAEQKIKKYKLFGKRKKVIKDLYNIIKDSPQVIPFYFTVTSMYDGKVHLLSRDSFDNDLDYVKALVASTYVPPINPFNTLIKTKKSFIHDVIDGGFKQAIPFVKGFDEIDIISTTPYHYDKIRNKKNTVFNLISSLYKLITHELNENDLKIIKLSNPNSVIRLHTPSSVLSVYNKNKIGANYVVFPLTFEL